jgi:hypothetical protein
MGEQKILYTMTVGKVEGNRPLGYQRTGIWEYGIDSSSHGHEPVAGSCEHGNEPSGSIKSR